MAESRPDRVELLVVMPSSKLLDVETDYVVVGSGPGGASVARGLARSGRSVAILERGQDYRDWSLYGTYFGALTYADRHALLFTREGLNIIRPLMAGGATSMYCGCAAPPPDWLKDKYHIDLNPLVDVITRELGLAPLPPALRGRASTRLAEAGCALGQDWQPLLKFIRLDRGGPFDCGSKCMLGCRCGAKWNAAEWVDDAVAAGAKFFTQARVDELIMDGRRASGGVRGRLRGQPFEVHARTVILSAGGIGSPLLLRRAGLARAGQGIAVDTTVIVYGTSRRLGNGDDPPMTYAWENPEDGYMLSTLADPWLMYPIIAGIKGPRYALTWPRWGHTLGVMVKLKDDTSGDVAAEHDISKPFTLADQTKLDRATSVARRIMLKAGAEPESIFVTPARGTHPCATVRIGDLLDANLQTEFDNVYVCDASAFPESLARPTVLTILALGERLAGHLIAKESQPLDVQAA